MCQLTRASGDSLNKTGTTNLRENDLGITWVKKKDTVGVQQDMSYNELPPYAELQQSMTPLNLYSMSTFMHVTLITANIFLIEDFF